MAKIIFRYTRQLRAYADSVGSMLVLLEQDDDKDKVIEEIQADNSYWRSNYYEKELKEYKDETYDIKGRLLLFGCRDGYTD